MRSLVILLAAALLLAAADGQRSRGPGRRSGGGQTGGRRGSAGGRGSGGRGPGGGRRPGGGGQGGGDGGQRGGADRRPPVTPLEASKASGGPPQGLLHDVQMMLAAGCLPADAQIPEFEECVAITPGTPEELACVAKGSGFANTEGYDSQASQEFINGLSTDAAWNTLASVRLANCSEMMAPSLPAKSQGVYMFACWFGLMKFECNRIRTAAGLQEIEDADEIAEDVVFVGEALPYLVEGHCISMGLPKPEPLMEAFNECTEENDYDSNVLEEAGEAYMMFNNGANDFELPSAEEISELREQIDKLSDTIYCTMSATGEITSAGELDFDQMRENLNTSYGEITSRRRRRKGRQDHIKMAALEVMNSCEAHSQTTFDQFTECWFGSLPYACTSLKAHYVSAVALRPEGCGGGQGQRRRGRGGQRRGGGGRRGNGRRRVRKRRPTPQPEVEEPSPPEPVEPVMEV